MFVRAITAIAILGAVGVPDLLASGVESAGAPGVIELAAEDVVVIAAPSERGARILVTFPGLEALGRTVISARLLLPHIEPAEDLSLEIRPLTRSWDPATVTWNYPWTMVGGDLDQDARAISRVPMDRDPGPIGLNITRIVRPIADEEQPNHGFIIKISDAFGGSEEGLELPAGAVSGLPAAASDIRMILVCGATD